MQNREDYKFANLSSSNLDRLREVEQKLKAEAGKEIIVLAYTKE